MIAAAHESLVLRARHRVHAVAVELAEHGLSAETIREAMGDIATTASGCAEKFIARYDAAQEARAVEIDREDGT